MLKNCKIFTLHNMANNKEELLTIITPTYNRGYIINKAFESLQKQSDTNFVWMIVDDGSTDNTESLVSEFMSKASFHIVYIKQNNGGKHRALNTGIKQIITELTLILDSDDYLLPEAVEIIHLYWREVRENKDVAYMSFLRTYPNGQIIGDNYPEESIISDHITMCINGKVGGDKSEVYRTSVLKDNLFPEIDGEKFLSEGVVWNRIGKQYKTYYRNLPIYVTEYLEDGLTKSSMKLRLANPIGAMMFANECISSEYIFMNQIKYAILYDLFYISACRQKTIGQCETKFDLLRLATFPISLVYYIKLKISGLC